jgi:hypothetical protein
MAKVEGLSEISLSMLAVAVNALNLTLEPPPDVPGVVDDLDLISDSFVVGVRFIMLLLIG